MIRKSTLAGAGGVVAAFLGSLCCIGPLLFVGLGLTAAAASPFEPYRPVFGAVMVAALGYSFWRVYGRRTAPAQAGAEGATCATGDACAVPGSTTRDRVLVWAAAVLALVFWTSPTWTKWLR